MSKYRRVYQKSGKYFFTIVTHKRKPILKNPSAIKLLRKAFSYTMNKKPFELESIVILPDHIHCIWQLPDEDDDFPSRWKIIKWYFSLNYQSITNHRNEKNIWQRRYWEHLIRNDKDWIIHMNYINYNPVKHGYVTRPIDWPYGSFKKHVEQGWYHKYWGSTMPNTYVDLAFE